MELQGFDRLFESSTLQAALAVIVKLGIGAVCASVIGYEREIHGRPAGVRTHMLVAIGVILFTEISRAFVPDDGGRIASQVVTGIGFLGAGSILRLGAEVKGLTSAASIWAVAAIAMSISQGGEFIWIALVATIATLFTLAVVDNIEKKMIPYAHPRNIVIEMADSADPYAVVRQVESIGCSVKSVRFRSRGPKPIVELDVVHLSADAVARIAALENVETAMLSD